MKECYFFSHTGSEEIRLDLFLVEQFGSDPDFDGITRSQIKQWIEGGAVLVDGAAANKAGTLLKSESVVQVDPRFHRQEDLEPYDPPVPLQVFYEDRELIVIDKPANLTMHPGAGNQRETLLNALVGRLRFDEKDRREAPAQQFRLGVVHRLDKGTTGVVVVAKTVGVHQMLAKQFSERTVGRTYHALVLATPRAKRITSQADAGRIETLIGRDPHRRTAMAVVESGGKRAITHWKALERMYYGSLLELRLETGRTHQIRVHMHSVGSPVVGDPLYGDFSLLPPPLFNAAKSFGRQALHARSLAFDHPVTGKHLVFESPLPKDLEELISRFRSHEL